MHVSENRIRLPLYFDSTTPDSLNSERRRNLVQVKHRRFRDPLLESISNRSSSDSPRFLVQNLITERMANGREKTKIAIRVAVADGCCRKLQARGCQGS